MTQADKNRTNSDTTVTASIPLDLIKLGAKRGICPSHIMDSAMLHNEELADPSGRVSYEQALGIWLELDRCRPKTSWGLDLADASANGWGALALAASNSASGFDALKLLCDFSQTVSSHGSITWEENNDQIKVQIHHVSEVEEIAFPIDYSLATIRRLLLGSSDQRAVKKVSLKHRPLGREDTYQRAFGQEVVFRNQQNAIFIDKGALLKPRSHVDPRIPQFLQAHLNNDLQRLSRYSKSFKSRIMRAVNFAVRSRQFSLETLATQMGMSPRTLQRMARKEAIQPSTLLENAKQDLSFALLADPSASIAQVADELNYSDVRSFTRAFIRWTGKSPASWRKGDQARFI